MLLEIMQVRFDDSTLDIHLIHGPTSDLSADLDAITKVSTSSWQLVGQNSEGVS